MSAISYKIIDLICVLGIIFGIRLMSSPKTARAGNLLGAACMLAVIITTMVSNKIISMNILWISMAIGTVISCFLVLYVTMTKMPELVALLIGIGGAACATVAFAILAGNPSESGVARFSGAFAMVAGSITLGGSLIAAAKLNGKMTQKSIVLKGHFTLNLLTFLAAGICIPLITIVPSHAVILLSVLSILISFVFSILFTIRIGGADMPITIALLNSLHGVATTLVGFVTSNFLVVAIGAIIGSAGIVLTRLMCEAMNSSIIEVLTGKTAVSTIPGIKSDTAIPNSPVGPSPNTMTTEDMSAVLDEAAALIVAAKKVIIVPGYGMALAQAQFQVKQLLDYLTVQNKTVKFAIHPVAGRMPGHMYVLLAEAEIPYDILCPMEAINPEFEGTHLVFVIGANDVINPAAKTAEGTPIFGMPVLNVDQADHVIICNKDARPGYAGVDNPLYTSQKATLLFGDGSEILGRLLKKLQQEG